MEPIGLVGTLIAIVQLSGKITTLCLDYKVNVKDAPEDISRLLNEVRGLRGILERLVDLANTDAAMVPLPSLQDAETKDGVLATCLTDLAQLATVLEKGLADTASKWKALLWPLRQKDVAKSVQQISQVKSTLQLALATDTGVNVLEILSKTRDMSLASSMALLEEDGKTQQVLNWLPSVDCFAKHERALENKTFGTGKWLLDTKEYCQWKDQQSPVLWLNGIPGCGKTVLCSTVIEDVQARCSDHLRETMLYFHFDRVSHENASVETVVGTFLRQAIYHLGGVPSSLQSLYKIRKDNNQRMGKPLLKAFRDELRNMLSDFDAVYMVVDALDECKDEDLDQALGLLKDLMSLQVTGTTPQLFVASRHRAQIHDGLEELDPLIISVDESVIQRDIASFVNSKLGTDSRLRKWPQSFRNDVENQLVQQSGGMFQWAECQLTTLATCRNPAAAKRVLTSRPKSLDELYGSILQGIPEADYDMAVKPLRWLSFSQRPLRLAELADALAVGHGEDGTVLYDEDLKPWDIQEALDVCAGLVTVSSHPGAERSLTETTSVKLAHYSVKEFLLSESIKSGLVSRYALEASLVHSFLVESCLAYMVHAGNVEDDKAMPLFDYAARYWIPHMDKFSSMQSESESAHLPQAIMQQLFLSTTVFSKWTAAYNLERPWLRAGKYVKGREKLTPLYCASYLGLDSVCASLVCMGVDINARRGLLGSALHAAAYRGHSNIVQILICAGADVNMLNNGFISTPLVGAAKAGHADIAEILLEAGALPQHESRSPFDFDRKGDALFAAAARGDLTICKMFIDRGAKDYPVGKGRPRSSLLAAVCGKHVEVVREIIARGCHYSFPLRDIIFEASSLFAGQSSAANNDDVGLLRKLMQDGIQDKEALILASASGDEAQVNEILARTNNIEQIFTDPLELAVADGNMAIVKTLLAKCAHVKEAFFTAAETGNIEAMELLRERFGDGINDIEWAISPLVWACGTKGNVQAVRYLLDNMKVAIFEQAAVRSMISAGRNGALDNFEELLRHEAKIPTEGEDASRLVVAVASGGSIPLLKLLLDHGLHPKTIENCRGSYQQDDPLMATVELPTMDMALALLDAGLDVNHPRDGFNSDKMVTSLLAEVIYFAHDSLALELLRRGAKPNGGDDVPGKDNRTPLVLAIQKGLDHVVASLLEHGASATKPSVLWSREEPIPPIVAAAAQGRLSMIRRLMAHGADINASHQGGYTALHKAANHGDYEILRALLYDYRADVSLRLENGSLVSHSAAAWGQRNCLELLLDHGMDIDATNNDGRTPLHFAAESRHWDCVRLLLDRGARTDLRADDSRLTALDMAHLAREGKGRYNFSVDDEAISDEELGILLNRMDGQLLE